MIPRAFVPPPPALPFTSNVRRRPRHTICSKSLPSAPAPDGTPFPFQHRIEIPSGAQIESSPLENHLQHLRFGYESPRASSSTPPIIRYRCAKGHIVRTFLGSPACRVCPNCRLDAGTSSTTRGKKLTMCNIRALAAEKNGTLVSTEYLNARTPLTWRCEHGHVWKATVSNIKAGTWCPECARNSRKLSMKDMHAMAKHRGGQCLSTEYISEHVKLRWRCACGHEFLLAPNNIRRSAKGARKSSWCPICARQNRQKPSQKSSARVGSRVGSKLEL